MTVFDVKINSLTGGPADLDQYRGNALLIVNVASKCGSTPQYTALENLAEEFADRGLVVLARPATSSAARSRAPRRRSPNSAPPPTASRSR